MLRCITALALVATAWGQLPPQPSPPPEPPPSPPPPSPPADWNKCQLATDAYQAACTEPALGIYSDNLTANAAYCSNVACKYALLNATFYCPDPCETTGTLGPTAVLEINATSRLAFCDTCTSARVKVSTACGSATLPSEGIPADPIAAYCTNTECSRALSDMMGLCQSGLEDTQEAVNGFGWSSQIPHLGVPSAGAGYFDDAVAALSYCQSEDPPSAEMLEEQTALRRNWYRIYRQYAFGTQERTSGAPVLAALTDEYPTDADIIQDFDRGVSVGTRYPTVAPPFAQGTVYTDKSTCETACHALTRCDSGEATGANPPLQWPTCFDDTANGGSCSDSCDDCASSFSTCDPYTAQGISCPAPGDGAPRNYFETSSGCPFSGSSSTPTWQLQSEEVACSWDDGTGGQTCPSRGAAFNSTLAFQVADWSAFGGRPVDWERYAFAYDDAATTPWNPTGLLGLSSSNRWAQAKISRIGSQDLFSVPNNSGIAIIGPGVCEAVVFRPYNLGSFILNGSASSNIAVIQFINQSPESLAIIGGNVNLAGGINYGPGPVSISTLGRVIVSNIDNYGTVAFQDGQRVFLLGANNFAGASLTLTNVAGRVYQANNFGTITVSQASASLESVVNNGTITATDVTANLTAATNGVDGTITVNRGSYTFVGTDLVNYGTITVGEAASRSRRLQTTTPTVVSIEGGENYGTVQVNSGTIDLTLDVNNGPIVLASGVTGSVRIVTGTVVAPTGGGAAAVTVTVGAAPSSPSSGSDNSLSTGAVVGIILAVMGPVGLLSAYLFLKPGSKGGGKSATATSSATA